MKVTGNTSSDLTATKPAHSNTSKTGLDAAQVAKFSASDTGVTVALTSAARSLTKDALNSSAEIDTKKVHQMKAAIRDGSFTVNPEAIADKLLSNAQEMLNTTPT
jgi:negative regulator of flagellin synthesis FlgM